MANNLFYLFSSHHIARLQIGPLDLFGYKRATDGTYILVENPGFGGFDLFGAKCTTLILPW